MERRSERWELRGAFLTLAVLLAGSAALALVGLDWAWRACAMAVGMALGYGAAYLAASWIGTGWVLRVVFGLLGLAMFGAGFLFFVGSDTVWSGFLYGVGFALFLAIVRGLAAR